MMIITVTMVLYPIFILRNDHNHGTSRLFSEQLMFLLRKFRFVVVV